MRQRKISQRAAFLGSFFAVAVLVIAPLSWANHLGNTAASLAGLIYEEDATTPVENAVVVIRNLATGQEHQSSATDMRGTFLINGVDEGRYILGVKTKDGNYNFEFELFLKGGETGNVSLALKPNASETAVVARKKSRKPFFLTPIGIISAVGGLGATGAIVYNATKSNNETSVSPH